jgi:hypothetical protein
MRRKGRSEGTITNYRDHVERLLGDWIDQPLSVLGDEPALVKARHDKLTEENGAYTPIAPSSQIGPEDPHYGWTTSKGEDHYSATAVA